ncbi:MAG: mercury(II) reductase [Alphaproteobacteria bacterium]
MTECCSPSKGGKHFDLAVIGAGSAGFSAAITAAELGAQVALIGHGTIGGTCVNIGCVPSKTLIRTAEALHQAGAAARFAGVVARAGMRDWAAAVEQKDELVADLRQSKYLDLLQAYQTIFYVEGRARLAEGGVAVNENLVRAGRVVITTGARPSVPSIPGIENVNYLTSTSALSLDALPKSLLVIGGGFIGTELAQMFARMGVKVTITCRSHLLPAAEPEISDALSSYFRDEGIALRCGVNYQNVSQRDAGIALALSGDGGAATIVAERLLVAAGRTPNVEDLGLAQAGVAQTPSGAIRVDDRMRTTRPATYAAGDVTGRDQFVYMAAYGAKLAARNALDGDKLRYGNRAMPAVVFSDPQVASVALTEAAARAAGYDVVVSLLPLNAVPRALAARDKRGLIKLIADQRSRKLLGAHILAPEGCDSIQTAALAIHQGLTIDDLAQLTFPYLTTVEGLKLAALAFDKDMAKLSCCAG